MYRRMMDMRSAGGFGCNYCLEKRKSPNMFGRIGVAMVAFVCVVLYGVMMCGVWCMRVLCAEREQ